MMNKPRSIAKPYSVLIALTLILLAGYYSGRVIGAGLVRGFITGSGWSSMIFFSPADQFFRMYGMVNSGNDLRRLSGYYSLLDNAMVRNDFLADRYEKENDPAVKRTIIWLMRYAPDREATLDFYSRMYGKAPENVRGQILKSMKILDSVFYGKFVEEQLEGEEPAPDSTILPDGGRV